jgi:hypothetical protein
MLTTQELQNSSLAKRLDTVNSNLRIEGNRGRLSLIFNRTRLAILNLQNSLTKTSLIYLKKACDTALNQVAGVLRPDRWCVDSSRTWFWAMITWTSRWWPRPLTLRNCKTQMKEQKVQDSTEALFPAQQIIVIRLTLEEWCSRWSTLAFLPQMDTLATTCQSTLIYKEVRILLLPTCETFCLFIM